MVPVLGAQPSVRAGPVPRHTQVPHRILQVPARWAAPAGTQGWGRREGLGCHTGLPYGITLSPRPPPPPPDNHRVKTVCENNELRLHCRPKSVLAIYSAHYGRFLRGKPECDAPNAGGPHIGMRGAGLQPGSWLGAVLSAVPMAGGPVSLQSAWPRMHCGGSPRSATAKGTAR